MPGQALTGHSSYALLRLSFDEKEEEGENMRKWMKNGIKECLATVSSSHLNTFRARQRNCSNTCSRLVFSNSVELSQIKSFDIVYCQS